MALTREQITAAVQAALEPLPWVHALWEGGSAAFNRLDQWSDLDLVADCDDERVDEVFALVEGCIANLSGGDRPGEPAIALRYQLPPPTFHGHAQCFYQLRDAGPYLLLDLVVMKHDQGMRFSEREQHGTPIVYFDKTSSVKMTELDWAAHIKLLQSRIEALAASFPLFQSLVEKEFLRGDALNAFSFFQGLTLRPLVELLRIIHDPAKHSFHLRYAQLYLPRDVSTRQERYCFVRDQQELNTRHREAVEWFAALLPQARSAVANLREKRGLGVHGQAEVL